MTDTLQNPIPGFNLDQANAKGFKQLIADFTAWSAQEPPPVKKRYKDGWTTFTPEDSLNFLRRTVAHKANRKVGFGTVQYYAAQMRANDWVATGQPMIFNKNDDGEDGQHRAWASVLTQCSFPTYVIASVEPHANLFAYLDNAKSRSAADALETAGMNGHSRLIAQVITLAKLYESEVMTVTAKGRLAKVSPPNVLQYAREHPEVTQAAILMTSEYTNVSDMLLKPDIAAFVGYLILRDFGNDVLEEFMTGLAGADIAGSNTTGSPLVALKKKLYQFKEHDETLAGQKKPTKGVWILAHAIKAFNAWKQHQAMRTVGVRVDENMPKFSDNAATTDAEAA